MTAAEAYEEYKPDLLWVAWRGCRHGENQEDDVHNAFVALLERDGQVDNVRSWLWGVTWRGSVWRGRRLRREANILDYAISYDPQLDESIAKQQRLDAVISTLPANYQEIVRRFYFVGEAADDIAVDMGISRHQFDCAKSRAIAKMREAARKFNRLPLRQVR